MRIPHPVRRSAAKARAAKTRAAKTRAATIATAAVVAALALTGCASATTGNSANSDGRPHIVASTGVWGEIAATVGGDLVQVTTIIDEPGMDPHEYQTTPADVLAVSKADLAVFNGGGYDGFMESILQTLGEKVPSVNAYTLPITDRGLDGTRTQDDENEHVWFDLTTVDAVAADIAAQLAVIDPAHAADYTANAQALHLQLRGLADEAAAIKAAGPRPVITTEPVPHYLLLQAGIEDLTPAEFGEAIEQGTDPAPAVIAEIRKRLDSGEAAALVYNTQTQSPTTQSLRTAAEKAGLPVIEVSESLPDGLSYAAWVGEVFASLKSAVAPA